MLICPEQIVAHTAGSRPPIDEREAWPDSESRQRQSIPSPRTSLAMTLAQPRATARQTTSQPLAISQRIEEFGLVSAAEIRHRVDQMTCRGDS